MTQDCFCIKKLFDLHVTTAGCGRLVIEEQSKWMESGRPDSITVLLRIVSQQKEFDIEINTGGRTVFDVTEFFGSGANCLPDDIYCFEAKSCGRVYKISRAVFCSVDCKIEEILAQSDGDYTEYNRLNSISEAIKINAKLGKIDKASGLLKTLKKELQNKSCGQC